MVVFYSGYAIQVDREDFHQGFSIDSVLAAGRGVAGAELVVVDARCNPFERRFRVFSYGFAQVNSLVLVSEPFDWTADDREALRGLGKQMVAFLAAASGDAEKFFGKSVQTSFGRLQDIACPTITSSLTEEVVLS